MFGYGSVLASQGQEAQWKLAQAFADWNDLKGWSRFPPRRILDSVGSLNRERSGAYKHLFRQIKTWHIDQLPVCSCQNYCVLVFTVLARWQRPAQRARPTCCITKFRVTKHRLGQDNRTNGAWILRKCILSIPLNHTCCSPCFPDVEMKFGAPGFYSGSSLLVGPSPLGLHPGLLLLPSLHLSNL